MSNNTKQRKLKSQIRKRMERTGESYTDARMHVLRKHSHGEQTPSKQQINAERLEAVTKGMLEPLKALTQGHAFRVSESVQAALGPTLQASAALLGVSREMQKSLQAALSPALQASESISAMIHHSGR